MFIDDLLNMSRVYDNWERLVRATLRREQLRLYALRTPSDLSLASSSSFNFTASPARLSSFNLPSLLVGEAFDYDQILRLIAARTPSDLSLASCFSSFNFSVRNFLSLSFGKTFEYDEILRATNYFSQSNLIKKGHSGDLFRGVLGDGTVRKTKQQI